MSKNKYDVYAPLDGKIKYALKTASDYGYRLYLETKEGIFLFAHLAGFAVKEGDTIEAGQVIGTMGSTGFADDIHLHVSFFLPFTKKLTAEFATDPTFILQLASHYICNTKTSNGYGSKYHNPKLKFHEGLDYSGVNFIEGWKSKKIDPLFQDFRTKERYPKEYA